MSLTENQILNFLAELNNIQTNLRSVSFTYENEIDKINRINMMNDRDKDILISDLNNRILYLTKTCENYKDDNLEKSKYITELENDINETKNYLNELNKLASS